MFMRDINREDKLGSVRVTQQNIYEGRFCTQTHFLILFFEKDLKFTRVKKVMKGLMYHSFDCI